ncbi:MAG: rRNA maturation RNase YbeY [Bacteroidaceae bacterium]|nr:rRNA maturation RNase YbeY [Bacteroidaceae bacterium]
MISYQSDSVDMPQLDLPHITQWVERVAESYGMRVGDIAYIFCNDDRILEVNRQYLNHDYYTDIITFDYSTPHTISGDIFISLDTVKSNAEMLGTDPRRELLRVVIHGILHLCGINDKGPGEREIMEAAEEKALLVFLS